MMVAVTEKLDRVEELLFKHGCILAELQSSVVNQPTSESTPRLGNNASGSDSGRTTSSSPRHDMPFPGDSSGRGQRPSPTRHEVMSAFTTAGAVSATTSPSPPPGVGGRNDGSQSQSPSRSASVPVSTAADGGGSSTTAAAGGRSAAAGRVSRLAQLRRALGEIQQCADQADWRLGKLARKLDRHDAEIGDLRSKIIWAQVADCPHHHHGHYGVPQQQQLSPVSPHHSGHHYRPHQRSTQQDAGNLSAGSSGAVSAFGGSTASPVLHHHQQQQLQQPPKQFAFDRLVVIGAPQKTTKTPQPLPEMHTPRGDVIVGSASSDVVVVGPPTPSSYQQLQQSMPSTPRMHKPPTVSFHQHQLLGVAESQQQQQQRARAHHQHHVGQQHHQYQQQQLMVMMHGYVSGGISASLPNQSQPHHHHPQQQQQQQQQPYVHIGSPSYADTVRIRASTSLSPPPASSAGSNRVHDQRHQQLSGAATRDSSSGSASVDLSDSRMQQQQQQQQHWTVDKAEATPSVDRGPPGEPRPLKSSRECRSPPPRTGSPKGSATVERTSGDVESSSSKRQLSSESSSRPQDDAAASHLNVDRLRSLQTEIHNRDHMIQELMTNHDQQAQRAKQEVSKKEEWYEHKMRLLKQDKRRRGETIGKLLRCLDDMKDQGRLDESRVTEGRLVLAATLNSRGWSMEERIYAAVEAMEAERVAQRTHSSSDVNPDQSDSLCSASTDDSASQLEIVDDISAPGAEAAVVTSSSRDQAPTMTSSSSSSTSSSTAAERAGSCGAVSAAVVAPRQTAGTASQQHHHLNHHHQQQQQNHGHQQRQQQQQQQPTYVEFKPQWKTVNPWCNNHN